MDYRKVTHQLLQAVWVNGAEVIKAHNQLFECAEYTTLYKEDETPITQLDVLVNNNLMEWAHKNGYGYVGEEGNGVLDKEYLLYVDPIDGTIAFTRGMNTSTIIVSLMRMSGDTAVPVAAILYNPLNGHTWIADNGSTVYVRNRLGKGRPPRLLQSSQALPDKIRTSVCTFPQATYNLYAVKERIEVDPAFSDQAMGAFGYGAGLICSGLLDATLIGATAATESTAMSLLVQNAGGVACDLEGNLLHNFTFGEVRGKPDFVLPRGALFAANDTVAVRILNIIGECN